MGEQNDKLRELVDHYKQALKDIARQATIGYANPIRRAQVALDVGDNMEKAAQAQSPQPSQEN